eukprot:IDg13125t1
MKFPTDLMRSSAKGLSPARCPSCRRVPSYCHRSHAASRNDAPCPSSIRINAALRPILGRLAKDE